jgi:hypothetical protein
MDLNVHPKFYIGVRYWHTVSRERKERRRILLEAAVRNGVWCFRRCYLH